jgi:hypothetical protein
VIAVNPVVQMFPNNDAIFQDDNSHIHSQKCSVWFEEHEDALHLPWPAVTRLKYIEPLWSVLESRVSSRFPSPSSLKQLEDVLLEDGYSIALETIQNLCESIATRTQTVLQANGGPTPY